ncbi:cytochrome c oxidase assembly protein COX18, mitochondrial-like [Liolophura sinensis]|uniref:cytochrome c oxidase assembly protein COX18, mitochondrial-like n=1 Tax=Liolophura sinensis TaxID=3198878 RepID=UPI003158235E
MIELDIDCVSWMGLRNISAVRKMHRIKSLHKLPLALDACHRLNRNVCCLCQISSRRHISKETYQTYFSPESPPIGFAQDVLEAVHSVTGLPWWASIPLTTVAIRSCVTLPLQIYSYYILARVENLRPEIMQLSKRLKLEVADALKRFQWEEKYARRKYNATMKGLIRDLYIRDNCHPFKASVVMVVQIPMWICLSFALRNMSGFVPYDAPAPMSETCMQMASEGIMWFTDLTVPDTTWLLPLGLGIMNLLIVEMHTLKKEKDTRLQKIITNFLRCISVIMVPVAASVPSSMCLYWTSSSLFGLAQNIALKIPRVRRAVGIPKTPSESATPFQDMWEVAWTKYTRRKKQI